MERINRAQYDEINDLLLTDDDLDGLYRDMLNDIYDPIKICGLEYEAASTFEEVDPTAYRCGRCDFESNEGYEEVHTDFGALFYIHPDNVDEAEEKLEELKGGDNE